MNVPSYAYRGSKSNNFLMELTLTGSPTAGTVTGDIRSGTNLAAVVMGQYAGGQFMGYATFSGGYSGTAIFQPINGTLNGAGSNPGTLTLNPFPLTFNSQTSLLIFTLTSSVGPVPVHNPPPAPAPPPQQYTYLTEVGFGYTAVELSMSFQLSNGLYQVTGQAKVTNIRPQPETTLLQISGIYRPDAGPTAFSITGSSGPEDNPVFTGSIVSDGTFGGQMTGMPSLGIYSLFFSATPQ